MGFGVDIGPDTVMKVAGDASHLLSDARNLLRIKSKQHYEVRE